MDKDLLPDILVERVVKETNEYAATKSVKHFTDSAQALRLLAPLMQNEESAQYHRNHLKRYLVTMEYLRDLPKSTNVLEIGAPPYGMTLLMRQWMFDRLSITGYNEKSSDQYNKTSETDIRFTDSQGTVVFEAKEQRFNLEIHQWPFANDQFDLVISCETFEHLGLDPMHAYAEANRVLKPGGRLLVTVPNGISLSNGGRYLDGKQPNSFAVYRPQGFSLRHQREPTPDEVQVLLRSAGFEVEFLETINIEKPPEQSLGRMIGFCLLAAPLKWRRELIVARGVKRGPVLERYPTAENLYYQWDIPNLRAKK